MIRKSLVLLCLASLPALSQGTGGTPAVTTGQYNTSRTGANLNETVLNSVDVNTTQFGKLFSWPVDGEIYAQPLFVPGVNIGGRTTQVVYVATMHNSVYAFDAGNPGAPALWHINVGGSVAAPTSNGCPSSIYTGPELGILGTPAIDANAQTLYFVSASPSGGGYLHSMHAVDITTGQERPGSPTVIQPSVTGTGYNAQSNTISMGPGSTEIQRTALLLANGSVYASFGNCGPDNDPWHGWVVGYNASNLQTRTALFNSTPNSGQGGIWQSGRGLVSDAAGDLYFATGNATGSTITTGDSGRDAARSDYPMRLMQLSPGGQFVASYPPANYADLNTYDLDFSSSGPMLLPGTNNLIAGGKDGVMYLFATSNLGTPLQSFQAGGGSACSLTFDACDQIRDIAFWNNNLYVWATNDVLRSFNFSNGRFNPVPTSQGTISAGRLPATLAVSANGAQSGSGIVWSTTPDNVLHAFNAGNVASELWNSNQIPNRDALPTFTRFAEPTVANGRVYVATRSNQVVVYGLLSVFGLSTTVTSQKVIQGTATSIGVTVADLSNSGSPVALSVSGLPSGATASLSPATVTGSGLVTLTVTTATATPTGTYNLLVSGQAGAELRTASIALTVTTPDATPPTWSCCTYSDSGSFYTLTFTAQDTESGLQSIIPVQVVGAATNIPPFQPGTTSPVSFTATESGWSSYVKFQVTDVAGNVSYVDTALLDAGRAPGEPVPYGVKGITSDEGFLTIQNGTPGLKNVRIEVGQGLTTSQIEVAGLKDGEVRTVSLLSLLPDEGSDVTITPLGKPGGTALFVFGSEYTASSGVSKSKSGH